MKITEEQHRTLQKMKSFNVDVGNFIRDAIKEKINKEHKYLTPKKEKISQSKYLQNLLSQFKE